MREATIHVDIVRQLVATLDGVNDFFVLKRIVKLLRQQAEQAGCWARPNRTKEWTRVRRIIDWRGEDETVQSNRCTSERAWNVGEVSKCAQASIELTIKLREAAILGLFDITHTHGQIELVGDREDIVREDGERLAILPERVGGKITCRISAASEGQQEIARLTEQTCADTSLILGQESQ